MFHRSVFAVIQDDSPTAVCLCETEDRAKALGAVLKNVNRHSTFTVEQWLLYPGEIDWFRRKADPVTDSRPFDRH